MSRFLSIRIRAAALFAGALALTASWGQINHGCAKPLDSEFRLVQLVTRANGDIMEPMKMDFDMDAEGNVDVYYVERKGRVRKYDGRKKAVVAVGKINYSMPQVEHGLTGIALDPGFKANRQIFFFYSAAGSTQRVARFALNAAGELDMASEKVIISWPVGSGWHSGGALKFDGQGNLWITVGENAAADAGAPNTNDLRGKILRIRPKPDGTYDIPEGNLFPISPGGQSGTAKTKPEIFVMGVRNPYTVDYDNQTRRLVWGCVGPDGTGRPTEEHNMTTTPGFFGWPWFAGQNQVLRQGKDPAKPVHGASSGLLELPPARGSINAYGQSAAITGPIYRYNGMIESRVKLPPHFDGVWFVSDYNPGRSTVDTLGVNAAGTAKTAQARVFPNIRLLKPLDFKQGPDGALYIINYGGPDFSYSASTSLDRIEYTGTCRPVTSSIAARAGSAGPDFDLRGMKIKVGEARHQVRVIDLAGREVISIRGEEAGSHDLASALKGRTGIHIVEVITSSGRSQRKLTVPEG